MAGMQWDDYPQGMGESSANEPPRKTPKQTQFRTPKERDWFAIHRGTAQDSNLSFEARGLLFYLLSKPDDWIVQVPDIQKQGGIGRDKANKLLKELRDAGYIVTEMERNKRGTFENKIDRIYDVSTTLKSRTVDNHSSGNPQLHNIDIQETEKTPKRSAKAPARNLWFDAIVAAFGYDESGLTKHAKGVIATAAADLKKHGYTPEEIPLIHAYCVKRKFHDFGAMALAAHAENWRLSTRTNGHKPAQVPITDETPVATDDHIYNVRYFDPDDGSYIGTGRAAYETYKQRGGV